ncbi:hypothetical protein AJ80_02172 [Polytolypa hystricis UAMH7299]|uniref:Uncharacterized protein n=1 Tax=Polytolypa hystricis (strain UAMH7299) TaxID=1447883 RepID=A0A2B7YRX5_POLH7|nr:hypothetical protein AJ80_02172 [Polytolypa hystricis UAMH7299]
MPNTSPDIFESPAARERIRAKFNAIHSQPEDRDDSDVAHERLTLPVVDMATDFLSEWPTGEFLEEFYIALGDIECYTSILLPLALRRAGKRLDEFRAIYFPRAPSVRAIQSNLFKFHGHASTTTQSNSHAGKGVRSSSHSFDAAMKKTPPHQGVVSNETEFHDHNDQDSNTPDESNKESNDVNRDNSPHDKGGLEDEGPAFLDVAYTSDYSDDDEQYHPWQDVPELASHWPFATPEYLDTLFDEQFGRELQSPSETDSEADDTAPIEDELPMPRLLGYEARRVLTCKGESVELMLCGKDWNSGNGEHVLRLWLDNYRYFPGPISSHSQM